jgi:hypothetical protein
MWTSQELTESLGEVDNMRDHILKVPASNPNLEISYPDWDISWAPTIPP